MAADDLEGFENFHPRIEWPRIELTEQMADAVKSVLMGESPESYRRRKDMEEFRGMAEGKLKTEAMERIVAEAIETWYWSCPHCPFETESLTEGQAHVKPGGCF